MRVLLEIYNPANAKSLHFFYEDFVVNNCFFQTIWCFNWQGIGKYDQVQARIYARGPGPGRQIFRGGILKKSRLKNGMREKKAVHEREI